MANQPTKYKKFLAGAASATLVATAIVPTALAAEVEKAATDFSDVAATHTHYAAIMQAVERGLFDGYTDGTFKPENSIDRKGVVKSLAKYVIAQSEHKTFEEYITANKLADKVTPFNDVPATHGDAELFNASLIVKDSGIFTGSNNNLMPANVITRQQMAKVLVNGFGLKDLAGVESEVTDTDKAQAEYVNFINILSENNVTEVTTFNPTGAVKRGQMASFLNRAFDAAHKVTTPETATKVVSVSATNLKEVVVTFDGSVSKENAEEKSNYTLKSGKAIKSVVLSEDAKSVTITVEGTLANNKADAVSVSNFLDAKNVEFTTVDNALPVVESIKSLGTKSLKVVFSEPVTDLKQSNFTLDGKAYFGKVDLGANNRSVILTPFSSSALEVGDHKVSISGVKDFAGFVSLASTHDFTVVEDKDAPTVVEATATLESVVLTFSEDVDPSTISASKVYWKSGDSKKTATGTVEALADNKFKYTFSTANSLPTGTVDIHVEGTKDYSGNEIAKDTKVSVKPEIDQTRPEVNKVSVVDATTVKVTFSKTVNADSAEEVKNYTVLNKDGKVVSVQSATVDATDSKSVIVKLYTSLSTGENTLTIKNVKDNTKLQNTMLDYSGKIVRADKEAPSFEEIVSKTDRRVVLKFDKKMNVDTLVDYSNYLVKINGQLQALSSDVADISVMQDGTAVVITFAETINGKNVVFASGSSTTNANTSELQVLGVKDAAGNLLSEFTSANGTNVVDLTTNTVLALTNISTDAAYNGYDAELVDTKTVKVKFTAGINSASTGAFSYVVNGVEQIEDVEVDGTSTVTVKFKNDLGTAAAGLDLDVDFSKLTTIAGSNGTGVAVVDSSNLLDSVAPEVLDTGAYSLVANKITINYSEALTVVTGASQDLRDTDFTVTRISDNKKLNPIGDYDVAIAGGNKIEITLTDGRTVDSAYRVTVDGADYFSDLSVAGNGLEDSTGQTAKATATANMSGTLAHTTAGVAPTAGTPAVAGVDKVTFANAFSAGEVVTIDATALTLITGGSASATALEVKGLVDANPTLSAKYTVAVSADVLTFTEKVGQENAAVLTVTDDSAVGTTVASSTTTGAPAIAPTSGVAQVETLTVSGTALVSGNITVTFNDGGTPVVKTVAVVKDETATQVAAKINTAFATGLTGWTATNAGADVVFTATPAANKTVTVTVAN